MGDGRDACFLGMGWPLNLKPKSVCTHLRALHKHTDLRSYFNLQLQQLLGKYIDIVHIIYSCIYTLFFLWISKHIMRCLEDTSFINIDIKYNFIEINTFNDP